MIFLIDHNIEGHARILLGSIVSQGWLALVPIRFIMFEEIGLEIDSSDRAVWRVAQKKQMIGSIKKYFAEQLDEEIGDLKASCFLDFCLQEICPSIYNLAIMDARSFIENQLSDLEAICYEPEFDYWEE